jgi:hypothetical protein
VASHVPQENQYDRNGIQQDLDRTTQYSRLVCAIRDRD